MGNSEKMQAIGDIISYFFPIILIVTLKRAQKSNWGKKYDIFSSLLYHYRRCTGGGKYGRREIKSYFTRWTQSFLCDSIYIS